MDRDQLILATRAECILTGKAYLCTNISAVKARELIQLGLVSAEQCAAVGIHV